MIPSKSYAPLERILTGTCEDPEKCDSITVTYEGVRLHVYGFLHGITGAGNRRYRDFVQKSIYAAPQPVLIENHFLRVYRGVTASLEDWAPTNLWGVFCVPSRFASRPNALTSLSAVLLNECYAKGDRFRTSRRVEHLGDSPQFHLLEPAQRRQLCGFPDPEDYLRVNLERRLNPFARRVVAIHIPDDRWAWIHALEPVSDIPLRSVHMLEFAAAYAHEKQLSEISLFVGETHNTDIAWLAENLSTFEASLNPRAKALVKDIRKVAREIGIAVARGKQFDAERLRVTAIFGSGVALTIAVLGTLAIGTTIGLQKTVQSFAHHPSET